MPETHPPVTIQCSCPLLFVFLAPVLLTPVVQPEIHRLIVLWRERRIGLVTSLLIDPDCLQCRNERDELLWKKIIRVPLPNSIDLCIQGLIVRRLGCLGEFPSVLQSPVPIIRPTIHRNVRDIGPTFKSNEPTDVTFKQTFLVLKCRCTQLTAVMPDLLRLDPTAHTTGQEGSQG